MLNKLFQLRLNFPKNTVIYDPDIIKEYMNKLPANVEQFFEELKRSCTLIHLLSDERFQAMEFLTLKLVTKIHI